MNRRSVALTTATVVIGVGFGAAVAVPAAADWYQHRSPAAVSAAAGAYAAPSPGSDAGSASVSGTVAAVDGKGAARAAKAAERPSASTGAFGYVVRSTGGDRILRVALPHHSTPASCRPSAHSVPWFRAHQSDPGTARAGARTPVHCGPHAAHPAGDAPYAQGHAGHR
ncbi:hypothetical protein [Streptomyces sp. NPDC093225]|uniref:hypothetical protein n=1 Tax=Streptomyces sp. NPDC093225 TaxID=3366034 RepID=UPI0038040846